MRFAAPEWWFLVPVLAVAAWRWRALGLHRPLRAVALGLLVAVLARPQWRMAAGGFDVWLLVDRSASAAAGNDAGGAEARTILERTRGGEDRVRVIDFAAEAVRVDDAATAAGAGPGAREHTRTGLALDHALAQLASDRAARVLVLTDGYATEPLGDAAERLLRRGVPLDYRLVPPPPGDDVRVTEARAPARVLPGEAFLLEFAIAGGPPGARVPWVLRRDGREAVRGEAVLTPTRARVRLSDRAPAIAAALRYELELTPATDARAENNRGTLFVEVAGGPRVLLVTAYPDDPLADLLAAQGFGVERVVDPGQLTPAALTGARLVVLNNVAAPRFPSGLAEALRFFVEEQGGGLVMVGGERSFANGGWFGSALDPMLPVALELRREHRRLASALSLVLDRSGSMSAGAGAGRTKMDLANAGAARAVELLGELDAVAVHAVDSEAHTIVPLAQVGPNRARLMDTVRRIEAGGGGIFVHVGLSAGFEQLQSATAGQKHLVLFADAADAEEPGNHRMLLDVMRAAGVTVSVIALGTPQDADAALLEEIAELGRGRIFFTQEASELPAIFAQETVAVARALFVREPAGAAGTPGWAEIAARAPAWLTTVDGYNLTYLRPGATAALVTTDEEPAPLVAAWQRGAGRVAAVTFPLGGEFSTTARAWAGYGDFVQTLARWLAGEDTPPGVAVQTRVDGERLTVELRYDDAWSTRLAAAAPTLRIAESAWTTGGEGRGEVRTVEWERLAPGRLQAQLPLAAGRVVRGGVRVGSQALAFGPVVAATAAEWSFPRERLDELRDLARRSGGSERLDLSGVWREPRPPVWRDARAGLLVAWLLVLLAEALVTRLGWELRWWPRPRSAR